MAAFEQTNQNQTAIALSANEQISAISLRYRGRGLAKSVADSAKAQMEAEQRTSHLAPEAYRLSSLSEAAVAGVYRRGKDTMSESDLIRYFNETRSIRTKNCDFSESESIYESADPQNILEQEETSLCATADDAPIRLSALPRMAVKKLMTSIPEWFNTGASSSKQEKKSFPFSAFAAIVAVAVSLMLIVASTVMLTQAESRISELTVEADMLASEVAELRSDVDVHNNLLELREIAVEQYGMVDEKYVEMTYLDTETEESIEAYREERDGGIGLSALLSALGIK